MEYDKFLVSLYKKNNAIPQMFVEFNKRNDKFFAKIQTLKFFHGFLIIYSDRGYFSCEIKSLNDEIYLDSEFENDKDFIVCFCEKSMFIGKKGNIEINQKILSEFQSLYEKFIEDKKQKASLLNDKDYIVDGIMFKIFNKSNLEFFNKTKNQLMSIFKIGKRESGIEALIHNSKFVSIKNNDMKMYFGVIYKNTLPKLISMGYQVSSESVFEKEEGNKYYVIKENENGVNKEKLICLSFRNASDGEVVLKI